MHPASTTVLVCSDVPDAMLVTAHAASNCISVLDVYCNKAIRLGTSPENAMVQKFFPDEAFPLFPLPHKTLLNHSESDKK